LRKYGHARESESKLMSDIHADFLAQYFAEAMKVILQVFAAIILLYM